MKISLAIYGPPHSSQCANTAFHYARAALDAGHSIYRLFFYMDGVHNATVLAAPPQDEPHMPNNWSQLIQEYKIDAVVCVAAALRRGIVDAGEAARYEKQGYNLDKAYTLSGLGQLIEAAAESDLLISFGD